MKKDTFFQTFLLVLLLATMGSGAKAQEDITLKLRTMLNYYPVQCDSIVVQNTTQGTSTTLYYPDTMLTNHTVGIEEFTGANRDLRMGVLTANPYQDRVELLLTLPRTETVELCLFNELGQIEMVKTEKLPAGQHRLNVKTGATGLHILSARTPSDHCSVKLVQQGGTHGKTDIVIADALQNFPTEKRTMTTRSQFDFSVGDHLTLTTHANARYYDTVTPIHQSIGLTVSESGTVNFKAFREFETHSILHSDSIDLQNTIWDVLASSMFHYYNCLEYYTTDLGEEVESQVTFYDSTFCSVRCAGACNAAYYGGSQYPLSSPWIYNNYPNFYGKYRVEYEEYPDYNTIVTNLYVGPMDSLCCNLTYHYVISYNYDYNIIYVYDATRGHDPTGIAYFCYFRRKGRVGISVSETNFSGCHGKTVRSDTVEFQSDTVEFHYEDNVLRAQHHLLLNCAASSVVVAASLDGNTLTIDYFIDDNFSANCVCPTQLDYTINNLPSGTYNVIIRLDGRTIIHHQNYTF